MVDYFKVLGVDIDAPEEVIKAAYKAMAKKYHPDTYKGDPSDAEKRMKDINEAFEALMKEEYRRAYKNRVKDDQTQNPKEKDNTTYAKPHNKPEKELTQFQKTIGNIFSVIIVIAIIGFIIFAGYHIFEMIKGFMFP